jgi:hypothetical protein
MIRPRYDPNEETVNDLIGVAITIFDYFLVNSDNVTIAGQEIIFDLNGFTMSHILQFTPSVLQCIVRLFTRSLPLRFKALHFVNFPVAFVNLYTTVRLFLPEKIRNRVSY